ncbi:MAG: Kazal-type serine protease inhibitor [Patescibacteria group bacterium]
MNKPSAKFSFPIKRLSIAGDLKIRARLFQARVRRSLQFGLSRTLLTRMLAPALAVLIILPFAKIDIDGYVYANENIVRGDFLYEWKRDIELDKLHAMRSPINRANYFLQLSEWRMREADVAFGREMRGEYSFLIPSAKADDVIIRLSVGSISEGLIAEGVLFFQKSIYETKKIPKNKQSVVLRNIKKTLASNAFLLDEMAGQITEENSKKIITPIKNQYLEIARDWEMEAFPKEPVPQEPVPQEPLPNEVTPSEPTLADQPVEAEALPAGRQGEGQEEMSFVEPEMVDFRFYGDKWREANEHHDRFDQEIKHFEEKDWDWNEEEIRHFEEEERRLREEEEMRRREAEMRRFEEEFFREAEHLKKDWSVEFEDEVIINPEWKEKRDEFPEPRPEEPRPEEPQLNGCSEEFRPVCGELPMPDQSGPMQETFLNECELGKSGAHFLHEGGCEFIFEEELPPHEEKMRPPEEELPPHENFE